MPRATQRIVSVTIKQQQPRRGEELPRVIFELVLSNEAGSVFRRLNTRGVKQEVRRVIVAAVKRSYESSGLQKISGELWNFVVDSFSIRIEAAGANKLWIVAEWEKPNLVYFWILMFGGQTREHAIGPRHKAALWWQGIQGGRPVANVRHPGSTFQARSFIMVDETARGMLDDLLVRLMGPEPGDGQPIPPEDRKKALESERIVRIAMRVKRGMEIERVVHRLTAHKMRRILRQVGMSELVARTTAPFFNKWRVPGRNIPLVAVALLLIGKV